MLFLPVSHYPGRAADAMRRAIEARQDGRSPVPALMTAASCLRLAIKARAWANDDWATFHRT
jgi:hypothetical protein